MYNIFDVIKTKKALSGRDRSVLACGSEGTILEVYTRGKDVGYNVEFMDSDGNTTAVLVVDEADIEPIECATATETTNIVAFRAKKKVATVNVSQAKVQRSETSGQLEPAKAARSSGNGRIASKVGAKVDKRSTSAKPKKPTGRKSK